MKFNEAYKQTMKAVPVPNGLTESVTAAGRERRRTALKPALIATVLLAAFVTTAFAYGDIIRQFVFGSAKIEQVEEILPRDGDNMGGHIVSSYGFTGNQYRSAYKGVTEFDTVSELAAAAEFEVKVPSFLPKNATLNQIFGSRFTKEEKIYEAHLGYSIEWVAERTHTISNLNLLQFYIGDERMDIQTIKPIQKVMIGDCEASAILDDGIELIWVKDGIVYQLSCSTLLDLDTMISIAESIE